MDRLETERKPVLELHLRLRKESRSHPRSVDLRCGVHVRMYKETEGEEEVVCGEVAQIGLVNPYHLFFSTIEGHPMFGWSFASLALPPIRLIFLWMILT
jgi:hypothetical protein